MENNKKFLKKLVFDVRIFFVIGFTFAIIAIIFGNIIIGAAQIAVFIILGVIAALTTKNKEQQVTNYIENINHYLDSSAKGYMVNFPLPITVLDLTGVVIWYNDKFESIAGENLFEKTITDIASDVQVLKILENKDSISISTRLGGKSYQVVGNIVQSEDNKEKSYSIVLYWIDRTSELVNYERAVNSQILCCSVLIDNYEELIKNTPDTERSAVIAEIERIVDLWTEGLNGIYTKLEKDRYVVYFENEKLQWLIDNKFAILDSVKEIKKGNTIPATFSIGIGKGKNIRESSKFVSAAIDMALGRGGDQAVIKDSEQFRFFGGHSENYGKSTRVRSRVVANALRELMDQTDTVFVMGHKNPDADSFGACVAIALLTRARGAKAYIIAEGLQASVRKTLDLLNKDDSYSGTVISEQQAMPLVTKNSMVVIVDTHNPVIVESGRLMDAVNHRVLIDHHRKSTEFINDCVLVYHEPYASSTCEMMTEIIQYMNCGDLITREEAQAVYAGIVLDSKNFNIKTGVRTFEAAAFLRRKGVDTVEVKKLFQSDLDLYVKRAKIVSNATIYRQNHAISLWPCDEEYPNILASQAADELLNISDVKASYVLCKQGDTVFVSARSLGSYNVQVVMEQLGGGGHMTVAGAQIKEMPMHEVEEKLKNAIDSVE